MLSLYMLFLSLYEEPYLYYEADGEKRDNALRYVVNRRSNGQGIVSDKSLVFFNCPNARKKFAEPLIICHYAECSSVIKEDYYDVGRGYLFTPLYVSIPSFGLYLSRNDPKISRSYKPINDFGFSIYLSYYSYGHFVDVNAKGRREQGLLFNVFDNKFFEYRDILQQNCSVPMAVMSYVSSYQDKLSRNYDKCTITFRVEPYSDSALANYFDFSKQVSNRDRVFFELHSINDFLIGTFVNCRENERKSPINLNLFPFAEIKDDEVH